MPDQKTHLHRPLPTASVPRFPRPALVGACLLAACLTAYAAPADTARTAPTEERGLLEAVASRGTELIGSVRDGASDLVNSAMNFLGVPYRRGGNSVDAGFDCSGFTRHVFENSIGLVLPHRADEQANDPSLQKIDLKDLQPGDLVFFNTLRRTFSHVGIYLGDGKFIHAPRTGESVRVEDMRFAYWAHRFTGARRVPGLAGNGNGAAPAGALGGLSALANLPLSALQAVTGTPTPAATLPAAAVAPAAAASAARAPSPVGPR